MAKKLAKKKSPVAKTRKKTKVTSASKKMAAVKKSFTKTELLQCLVEKTGLSKKQVAEFLEIQQEIICAHLKNGFPFAHPGMYKITVVKKSATKARKGINPFTGEATTFKAKPARKVVKIKPLKKLKAAV
ncbi:HU family DNA-binding protein [Rickettsiella endosymbiont of Rhagonycha lignosa]|uniref:HU family DNA-binding protein n=1 Tax=Rickettsiella endosymbiont of Rhagonycha lignosa TaxID=3077937 RepID=UPI00313CB055